MPQPIGSRLGPYEIEASLGAGGMGEVYRARDTRLGRAIALKVLKAQLSAVPGQRDRFSREARAISSVEHPNICPLYDVGTSGDVDFIVMQLVEGESLAARIARGPIPLAQATALARQIALGLEAAHERGIVHRDLKPANVQVMHDGHVKLLDFGLARILDDGVPGALATAMPTQPAPSVAGSVVGTAAYMSPEQARGEPVDKRTDVWSFGCVLYEMLTGGRAFAGDSLPDVMAAVVGGEPDWSRLPAATPWRVRDLLRLSLRKDRTERLRDIGDARLQLEPDGLGEPDPTTPPPPARRSVPALAAWGVAAAALGALALVVARSRATREGPHSEMRFSVVTNYAGIEAQPSFSPDGRSIAFISNRGGQWDVYVGLVTGGSPVRVTSDANLELRPRWSPDGSRIAYGRLNEKGLVDIWVASALGGDARRIVPNARQPAWSPDGRRIAYSSGGTLWTSDAAGANPQPVTRSERPVAHYQPAFSHDGRTLAFLRRREGPYAELALTDVATGVVRELTHDNALAQSPAWSPDGRFVYFSSSRGGSLNIWKVGVSSGEPQRITAGVGDDAEIDLTPDGKRLVFSTYRANVNLGEVGLQGPSAGVIRWLTTDSAHFESYPAYSRDGKRIAYFSTRFGAERESIWVMDADGRNATRLVEDERASLMPRWSADGQSVVYVSRVPGIPAQAELRRVPVAGGAVEALGVAPWSSQWGDVGPDGRLLVRMSASSAELVDPRTAERLPVPDVLAHPTWSHDGQAFAYVVRPEEDDAAAGVWLGTLDGRRQRLASGWFVWCAWTRSGDLLALAAGPALDGELWRVSREGRRDKVLTSLPLTLRYQSELVGFSRFDVHPDGTRIVLEAFESHEADISMIENVR